MWNIFTASILNNDTNIKPENYEEQNEMQYMSNTLLFST